MGLRTLSVWMGAAVGLACGSTAERAALARDHVACGAVDMVAVLDDRAGLPRRSAQLQAAVLEDLAYALRVGTAGSLSLVSGTSGSVLISPENDANASPSRWVSQFWRLERAATDTLDLGKAVDTADALHDPMRGAPVALLLTTNGVTPKAPTAATRLFVGLKPGDVGRPGAVAWAGCADCARAYLPTSLGYASFAAASVALLNEACAAAGTRGLLGHGGTGLAAKLAALKGSGTETKAGLNALKAGLKNDSHSLVQTLVTFEVSRSAPSAKLAIRQLRKLVRDTLKVPPTVWDVRALSGDSLLGRLLAKYAPKLGKNTEEAPAERLLFALPEGLPAGALAQQFGSQGLLVDMLVGGAQDPTSVARALEGGLLQGLSPLASLQNVRQGPGLAALGGLPLNAAML